MRALGVHWLAVTCEMCHHEAVLPADRWDDAMLARVSGRAWCARAVGSSAPTRGQAGGRRTERES